MLTKEVVIWNVKLFHCLQKYWFQCSFILLLRWLLQACISNQFNQPPKTRYGSAKEDFIHHYRTHLCKIKTDPLSFDSVQDFESLFTNLRVVGHCRPNRTWLWGPSLSEDRRRQRQASQAVTGWRRSRFWENNIMRKDSVGLVEWKRIQTIWTCPDHSSSWHRKQQDSRGNCEGVLLQTQCNVSRAVRKVLLRKPGQSFHCVWRVRRVQRRYFKPAWRHHN